MTQLEIEQKFPLADSSDLEPRLKSLGFVPKDTTVFVDWYFDTECNYLTTRDCWLRYRARGDKGQWELKQGRVIDQDSATVYEEHEGDKAVSLSLSLISKVPAPTIRNSSRTFDGFEAPTPPGDVAQRLSPFCRLETTRSSWIVNPENKDSIYSGFAVDLDSTNTGHAVGEVETLVQSDADIPEARAQVKDLISKLTVDDASDDGPAVGKLEHFLKKFRPEHYDACVKSGSMRT